MLIKVAAVVKIRNEEKYIAKTLQTILNQDLKPYRVIVVNDGSTDKTGEILSKFSEVEVITNPVRESSHLGDKKLAAVMNQGLKKLHEDNSCEFVWMLDGDLMFEQNYTQRIIQCMQQDNAVISSGVIKGEYSTVPRGGGRIIDCTFLRQIGMIYPVNYGFDGYLVLKAASMGFLTKSYNDITFSAQRKTGSDYNLHVYFNRGLGFRALGYAPPYAFMAALFASKKRLRPMISILRGYFFKYDNLYEKELRDYVFKTQMRDMCNPIRIWKFFRRALLN